METITKIKEFTACMKACNQISQVGMLRTKDNKTSLHSFDGVTFVSCDIPEIKGNYKINLDIRIFLKLCKVLKEQDILNIEFKSDQIIATIKRPKYERKYEFPNLVDDKDEDFEKSIEKAGKINPPNEVHTTTEWIIEQTDGLIFKDVTKNTNKVALLLTEKTFQLKDDNPTSGSSTISLFSFDEYKIKFSNQCKVKINWSLIKEVVTILRGFSDKILIKLDNEYPVKLMSYEKEYKITTIIAPIIEND